ncbi:hypothetical protein QTP86_001227 [Hemibagrus guttatus]|nr:hypothetical protein QTP86_001227 [Hemibagrus guttatus]
MTTASPTSTGKLVSSGQNRSSKRRLEGKLQILGGQEVMATSPSRSGQQRASPVAQQPPRMGSTKKEAGKRIMGNPMDMDGDTTITSIIHTTTVISTMREQGQCSMNLTDAEGYIEMPPSTDSFDSTMDCTYYVSVYLGYGVEIQEGDKPIILQSPSARLRGNGNVAKLLIEAVVGFMQSCGTCYLSCREPNHSRYDTIEQRQQNKWLGM